jgi:hypothetical protein
MALSGVVSALRRPYPRVFNYSTSQEGNAYSAHQDIETLLHSFQINELKKVKEELAKAKAESQRKRRGTEGSRRTHENVLAAHIARNLTDVWYRGRPYDGYDDDEPSRRCSRCGKWKYPCECGDGYTRPE